MNIYETRWRNACSVVEKYKMQFDKKNCFLLDIDGDEIHHPNDKQLCIDYDNKRIYIASVVNGDVKCIQTIYEYDLRLDHGSYTPTKEFQQDFLSRYKLYQEVAL
jgi:hypothetical protein